jgi:ribose-phosphate pyrophosphokinase
VLLGFPDYRAPAQRLARAAGLPWAEVDLHHFPDAESRVRLPARLPEHVVLCQSLNRPNDKLVELILAAGAARQQGARRITLVAPYLCYMRQDKAFQPGEAISQRIVGAVLANWLDALITVDPHLHRVARLEEAVPVKSALALTASAEMSAFLAARLEAPLLIGPDAESRQWVSAIAGERGFEYCVADKARHGDRAVRVTLPTGDYQGRQIVLVDDMVSTGRTLEAAARALARHRPAGISVLVTHALFVDDALKRLHAAGVDAIWSSDSIPHPSNQFELGSLLARALRQISGHHP